jgi:hypothetical protein
MGKSDNRVWDFYFQCLYFWLSHRDLCERPGKHDRYELILFKEVSQLFTNSLKWNNDSQIKDKSGTWLSSCVKIKLAPPHKNSTDCRNWKIISLYRDNAGIRFQILVLVWGCCYFVSLYSYLVCNIVIYLLHRFVSIAFCFSYF